MFKAKRKSNNPHNTLRRALRDEALNSVTPTGVGGSSGILYREFCPLNLDPLNKCTRWIGILDNSESFSMRLDRLTKSSRYYFRALAKNSAGIGVASATVFEEGVALPSAPVDFDLNLQVD